MLQNKFARSIQELYYRFQISISPPLSFLTVTTFLSLQNVFTSNQRTDLDDISHVYHQHVHEKCSHLLMQHGSLILNNNDMKSRNFTSFTKGKKNIFQNIQVSLLVLHSCHIFIKKISVASNVNVTAIFTQHFVQNVS